MYQYSVHTVTQSWISEMGLPRKVTLRACTGSAPGEGQAASAPERSPQRDCVTELLVDTPRGSPRCRAVGA